MKKRIDKKYFAFGLTAFCTGAALIALWLILSRFSGLSQHVSNAIKVLQPILYGLLFAYILLPIQRWFETKVFKKTGEKVFTAEPKKKAAFLRGISITATMLLTILFLVGFFYMVVPSIADSIKMLVGNLSSYSAHGEELIRQICGDNEDMRETVLNLWGMASTKLIEYLNGDSVNQMGSLASIISSGAINVVSTAFNVVIGLIISVYILAARETFKAQSKKVLYAVFDTRRSKRILEDLHEANDIFSGFIWGKALDSLIIGIICYFLLLILHMPYRELISVIIGATNMIPFFGPFIGAVPSTILIFLIDPFKALQFVVMILILQQFDGNILGPKILGNFTGLNSFWVIFSITVFGGMFGFAGMLFGVPIFAVIYFLLRRLINQTLEKKNLVVKTEDYKKILYIDPENNEPVYASYSKCSLPKQKTEEN